MGEPFDYLGFMSPDRGICMRGSVMEKLVGPVDSANEGGHITTRQ